MALEATGWKGDEPKETSGYFVEIPDVPEVHNSSNLTSSIFLKDDMRLGMKLRMSDYIKLHPMLCHYLKSLLFYCWTIKPNTGNPRYVNGGRKSVVSGIAINRASFARAMSLTSRASNIYVH